jgi:catechol 2,3-dioxygenase-like lactoylglutathione lyase family enzyme
MNKPSSFPRMHVSLFSSDLQKTTDFYTTFFGQQPEKVMPGYAKYILNDPSLIISFAESPEKVQQRFGHLGFQVATLDELKSKKEEMEKAGLKTVVEFGTKCCYALQDKFWVADPDGHQWEVYYFHEDVVYNDPHYQMGEVKEATEVKSAGSGCC